MGWVVIRQRSKRGRLKKKEKKKGNIRVRAGAKAASYIISPDHLNYISPQSVSYGRLVS